MAITINQMSDLAQAIAHWLQYQEIIGKDELFSEAYLSQPIGDFLLHYRDSNKSELKTEYNHPILNLKQKKNGRPSQIDFIIKSSLAMTVAIEVKWFVYSQSNYSNSIKKIIHDLLRLEIMHGYKKSTDEDIRIMVSNLKTKIFICAGSSCDMKRLRNDKSIKKFLSFNKKTDKDREKQIDIINIINSNDNLKKIINDWLETYTIEKINNNPNNPNNPNDPFLDIEHYYEKISGNGVDIYKLKISKEFSTKLIGVSNTKDFCVYIWQVFQYAGKKSKYYVGK